MAKGQQHTPHPLITQPTLWVVDIPTHLKWPQLSELLKTCGEVRSCGKTTTPDGRQGWEIEFAGVYYAEMALATLNGLVVPNTSPPWTLTLSHTPSLESAFPKKPLCAQFVKASAGNPLLNASAQFLFKWFRTAGPLVVVRVGVDVGYPQRTSVIQYWYEEHALVALHDPSTLHLCLDRIPLFSMRTFAPYSLLCSNMECYFKQTDVEAMFGQFGTVIYSGVLKPGTRHCHVIVTFSKPEEASAAIAGLNGQLREWGKIRVRNYDLGAQPDFCLRNTRGLVLAPHQLTDEPPQQSNHGSTPSNDPPPTHNATPEAESAQANIRKEYEQKLADAKRRRAAAAEAANAARLQRIDADTLECAAKATLTRATANRDESYRLCTEASAALVAAKAALEKALARQTQMLEQFRAGKVLAAKAEMEHKAVAARRAEAEKREEMLAAAHHLAEKIEKELYATAPPEVEEERRREELEESIRRMRELHVAEEADRREKARGESQEKEEVERRRMQAERLAREELERPAHEEAERQAQEEHERQAAEANRLEAYKLAAAREVERCRKRDAKGKALGAQWTHARSVQWFMDVSVEFEDIRFCDTQPLVFESVPWPLLTAPHRTTIEDVEWGAVEAFFSAAKLQLAASEYKSFVEKAHRRFHPDKWRARGLLNTILDRELRQQLENAGNVVAQAITPIWSETKAKT